MCTSKPWRMPSLNETSMFTSSSAIAGSLNTQFPCTIKRSNQLASLPNLRSKSGPTSMPTASLESTSRPSAKSRSTSSSSHVPTTGRSIRRCRHCGDTSGTSRLRHSMFWIFTDLSFRFSCVTSCDPPNCVKRWRISGMSIPALIAIHPIPYVTIALPWTRISKACSRIRASRPDLRLWSALPHGITVGATCPRCPSRSVRRRQKSSGGWMYR
mmetsp:Transcript_17480/g.48496  ORF Transcript_17480/g.48496 Transcript_17480/m.48496 type:complete len:213 (+) Transcript_17480:69-707(+)